ncbi:hypothetical protein DDB_G0286739 [Dictyostelium discoideum AX4]|uniref:Uncharacterized protein n=1 Tax=Dictyostelium discoideum TaxID=44689 RepID=Q54LB0_DICDI|nr:hypothetical protein DDB_G0286739 [Dictyostelium discoideum AX4]EAL64125.1 hypothetical protein DDB_G0286739 [Dictyostelium discoideum AX4]|eukprot:XP_637651.1 hypothetical protein DDB_G0286739 [Dictyostelium discoideum AX4]
MVVINDEINNKKILPPILYGFKIITNKYGKFKRFDYYPTNGELNNCLIHRTEYNDISEECTILKQPLPFQIYIPTLVCTILTVITSIAFKIIDPPLTLIIGFLTPLVIFDIIFILIIIFKFKNRKLKFNLFLKELNEKFEKRSIKFYYKNYYTSKTICIEYYENNSSGSCKNSNYNNINNGFPMFNENSPLLNFKV